jgi:hypothetical protein
VLITARPLCSSAQKTDELLCAGAQDIEVCISYNGCRGVLARHTAARVDRRSRHGSERVIHSNNATSTCAGKDVYNTGGPEGSLLPVDGDVPISEQVGALCRPIYLTEMGHTTADGSLNEESDAAEG